MFILKHTALSKSVSPVQFESQLYCDIKPTRAGLGVADLSFIHLALTVHSGISRVELLPVALSQALVT